MESDNENESLMDRARRGAGHSLLAGAAGALFGGMKGYVSSQPVAFLASAYGANTMLFTGFYLGEDCSDRWKAKTLSDRPMFPTVDACLATFASVLQLREPLCSAL